MRFSSPHALRQFRSPSEFSEESRHESEGLLPGASFQEQPPQTQMALLPSTPIPDVFPSLDVRLLQRSEATERSRVQQSMQHDTSPSVEERSVLLPYASQSVTSITHPTLSTRAVRGLSRIELFATRSVQAMQKSEQLDLLATIPVAVLKGVGDTPGETQKIDSTKIRIVGILFLLTAIFYLLWLLHVLNTSVLWFSLPFFFATLYTTLLVLLTVYNNWYRSTPPLRKVAQGQEPTIAVLIPTYGEPVAMLRAPIESVLSQDWPSNRLVIVIGDDSHRPEVQEMVETLQMIFLSSRILYHEPPRKGDPTRKGQAKDGNLNSMLALVSTHYPAIEFIETRDADDIVGNPSFLRYCLGHFHATPHTAYVQTIKEALVSPGDPFGNRQSFFYRGVMFARHAAHAVFPCGSGLIWRKKSLERIGGFPTWNLVEDLYSGYVAMQCGLQGAYVPIVGAIGQVSPEDIPNVYKQLGTWALDTIRIFVWKNPWFVKGLTFQQKMQFTELGLFYLMSFPLMIFTITPMISLFFGLHPFLSSNLDYILHFWPYAAVIEILLALFADTTRFEDLWRARQMWFGMLFVYSKATFLAITYGPSKKPVYKVTRKVQQAGLYVRETLLQILLFLLLLSAVFYNILVHHNVLKDGDLGSMFWVLLYLLLLSGIIRRSWFGVKITLPERLLVKGHALHSQETLQGEVLSIQQSMVRLHVRSKELWQFLRFALVGTLNALVGLPQATIEGDDLLVRKIRLHP